MTTTPIKPLLGALCLALSSLSPAGGLYLYEMATEDLGLAGAGSAARAQDASTLASNPAGMTRLDGNQFSAGGQLLYGDLDYEMARGRIEGPGNVIGWLPAASIFYSHSISNDLKAGIGLYGNFGLSLDFGDQWAGRNLVSKATMIGMTLQPTLAYRIDDAWSLGAGLGINYGVFSLTRDQVGDSGEVTRDDHDWAANAHLGVMYTLSPDTRLGLMWTSEVKYQFDVDASGQLPLSGISWSLPVNAAVSSPQQAMFSVVHALDSRWTLLGNLGWQDWSRFSDMDVSTASRSVSSRLRLQDTWHVAAGVQYQWDAQTRLNMGIAHDDSMYVDQGDTSLTMPASATWRFGIGAQHALDSNTSLGLAFEYVDSGEARVSQPAPLAGRYSHPRMYFISANYAHRF
ncbi:fatty acid transporter [Aquitalea sp. S1-19]|nr:fatty acid transporter [Aquitalea sp. S1-19]